MKQTFNSFVFRTARFVAAICALAVAGAAPAEPNVYDLELVVFLNEMTRSSEVDRPDPERAARYNGMLTQRLQRTGSVLTESAESGRFVDIVDRLQAAGGYTVLQHVKWRQEVQLIADAPYIDVSALGLGEDSGLKGVVRFYHSPLLYVDVLLRYAPFVDPIEQFGTPANAGGVLPGEQVAGLQSPEARTWVIDEKRRVKLNELHYFDNPRLGAIIGVWPVDEAELEAAEAVTPSSDTPIAPLSSIAEPSAVE